MHIPLSKRLQLCCDFVRTGDRVADIGCDHGYLSIYLLTNGIAKSVFAADINEQPLQSAVKNAEKFGIQDSIQFFLSNGVDNVPREFDTLICAGMGADTMISILSNAPWLKNHQYRLILQCQSRTPLLRQYLSHEGWQIIRERVIRDGRFLYTAMEVHWNPENSQLTVGQCYFPPALLEKTTPELAEYLNRVLFSLRRAVTGQGDHADPNMQKALSELESEESLIQLKEM